MEKKMRSGTTKMLAGLKGLGGAGATNQDGK
jgi:hypothetical protein